MIESWGSLIDQLGGTGGVAEELALAPSVVSGWRKRGIPSTRWLAICGLGEAKRVPVSMETLARLASMPARQPAEART